MKGKEIPWVGATELRKKKAINSCFQLVIVRFLLKAKNTELNHPSGEREMHFHYSL